MPEVTVVQGKTKCQITFPDGATYQDLKALIAADLLVEPAHQKLIVKGKTPGDAEGVNGGDKIMLMLSEVGHMQLKAAEDEIEKKRKREESVAAAKAAAELKEEMRPGGGSEAAGVRAVVGGGSGFTVICEAGADYKAVVDSGDAAAWVMVIHGKTRFRMLLGGAGEAFGGFKARLAVVSKIPAAGQRLIFKGKEQPDTQALDAAGVTKGAKMILMLQEGQHRALDEESLIRELAAELLTLETSLGTVQRRCEHGFGDGVELSLEIGRCAEVSDRLSDNASYLSHSSLADEKKRELESRLKAVRDTLSSLQKKYLVGGK